MDDPGKALGDYTEGGGEKETNLEVARSPQ